MQSTNSTVLRQKRSLVAIMGGAVRAAWKPVPLSTPEIDPHLTDLSALERVAEVLRYKLLQIEYAISADGGVRAWLRLNLLFACLLAIPAVFVVPVITWLMGSFVTLTGFLLAAAQNLLYAAITIIAAISLVLAFGYGLKIILKAQQQQRSRKSRDRY